LESEQYLRYMEEYAKERYIPIIKEETKKLLNILIKLLNPERILEIGTAIGYSAIHFAFFAEKAQIITIEKDENMFYMALNNIKKLGLENRITVIYGDAVEVLPSFRNSFDFIFLDAAKGQYIQFLPHCIRLLRNGGLLVSDNISVCGLLEKEILSVERRKRTMIKKMKRYIGEITNNPILDTLIIPIDDGVAISYKKEGGLNE